MKTNHTTRVGLTMILILMVFILGACSANPTSTATETRTKVGIVMTEVGLGDRSFNDAAFDGLVRARDENSIVFDYREPNEKLTAEASFEQFAESNFDLIIGLSDTVQADMEKVATKYPDRQFLLIDSKSELPNIASISFRAEEGSYLAGIIAGMATTEDHVGFLGGMEIPVLRNFEQGFEQGVLAANPDAKVDIIYAGDFGNAKLGEELAAQLIQENGADVIYVAAGLTGVGALTEIQKLGKYAIGVDTDQFFLAEKAILTSMLKNVDVSIYNAVHTFIQNKHAFPQKQIVEGLAENAVGLTALHNITLSDEEQQTFEDLKTQISSGQIKIKLDQ
ncbi:BMP family ABC transporter substrate-binding protein [Paenibacillus sp. MER 99-2]|uniref:BMP family lipoprotein n=1 Tax=Paenibacillus sp. MER 99-2 TaxID=2939572 RepID=UPI0020403ECB|nr:BMP family ABC transporter substrate-binding protein [Paenibacillus sp. MER 99-2]MCM3174668.1 BMP family ABC transporter substrate-binding protein [Paenibacillus sp. MER 99-2]